jgi:hypothetical protein
MENLSQKEKTILPIVGYRFWGILKDGTLIPIGDLGHDKWTYGVNHSYCYDSECPGMENCECGFYAFREIPPLKLWSNLEMRISGFVMGSVIGWGKVTLHETGWRSEYAKPIALVRTWGTSNRKIKRAEKNGMRVVSYKNLEKITSEHGDQLPLKKQKGNFWNDLDKPKSALVFDSGFGILFTCLAIILFWAEASTPPQPSIIGAMTFFVIAILAIPLIRRTMRWRKFSKNK